MTSFRYSRPFFTLCLIVAVMAASGFGGSRADDLSDAWANVSTMIKFIGMGEASSTAEAGNRSMSSIEKAIDAQDDTSKKGKLRDALAEVRTALGHAGKGEWPYAEGAAKRALKLIEEVR